MKKFLLYLLLTVNCSLLIAFDYDFGVILDQNASLGGLGGSGSFEYSGILVPRFSTHFSDMGELYVSAGIQAEYLNDAGNIAPELLRTEMSLRFGALGIRAGRMAYSDPLGFIAAGLFDGAQVFYDTQAGIFNAGAWYTGLLYKKRANIAMTGAELKSYNAGLDWDDNSYFAPSRMIAALGWEHPALREFMRVRAAVLGQFDLNQNANLANLDLSGYIPLHSQYLAAKVTVPLGAFIFDLGGGLSLMQTDGTWEGVALAGEFGAAWHLTAPFDSRLSVTGRITSGVTEDTGIRNFIPIAADFQGNVLKARIPGLSVITLDYLARPLQTLAASLTSSFFIMSDLGYTEYPANIEGNTNYFLGTEIFGRALWSPYSDLQLNLGAGAFIPALGNVAQDADVLWRLELGVIFSIY
ncbi:MAG: hypothetical protein FWG89_04460 [Treponema sp.]|nr:hypothetical protein [Treponema sp.]